MATTQKKTVRLDLDLLRQATEAAEKEGVSVDHLVEKAVQSYLGQRLHPKPRLEVEDPVAASRGVIRVPRELLKQVLEEENVLET